MTYSPPTTVTPSVDQVASAQVLTPVVSTITPSLMCSVVPLTGLALALSLLASLGVPATVVSGRKVPPDVMPPPTTCEVNVAPPRTGSCRNCIPEVSFVCDVHQRLCGGESLLCCSFCVRALCHRHMYCPCDAAKRRRHQVARDTRAGKIKVPSRSVPVLDCDGKFKFPSPVSDSLVSVSSVNVEVKMPVSAPVLPTTPINPPINLTTDVVPVPLVNINEASVSSVHPDNVAVLAGSVPASAVRSLSHINVSTILL